MNKDAIKFARSAAIFSAVNGNLALLVDTVGAMHEFKLSQREYELFVKNYKILNSQLTEKIRFVKHSRPSEALKAEYPDYAKLHETMIDSLKDLSTNLNSMRVNLKKENKIYQNKGKTNNVS